MSIFAAHLVFSGSVQIRFPAPPFNLSAEIKRFVGRDESYVALRPQWWRRNRFSVDSSHSRSQQAFATPRASEIHLPILTTFFKSYCYDVSNWQNCLSLFFYDGFLVMQSTLNGSLFFSFQSTLTIQTHRSRKTASIRCPHLPKSSLVFRFRALNSLFEP